MDFGQKSWLKCHYPIISFHGTLRSHCIGEAARSWGAKKGGTVPAVRSKWRGFPHSKKAVRRFASRRVPGG